MKLSICTDVMGDLSFTDMLDKCVALGVEGVEMTGGGWSPAPHFRADELLADKGLLKRKLSEIEARGLKFAALNCSGKPLDPGALTPRRLPRCKMVNSLPVQQSKLMQVVAEYRFNLSQGEGQLRLFEMGTGR